MTQTLIGSVDHPAIAARHPGTREVVQWFAFDHLGDGPPYETSRRFAHLAFDLLNTLPDSPELTVALRKLLEGKDAAVRATIAAHRPAPDGFVHWADDEGVRACGATAGLKTVFNGHGAAITCPACNALLDRSPRNSK